MMDGKVLQAILDEIPFGEKAEKVHALVYRHDSIIRNLMNYGWSNKEDEPALVEELKQIRRDLNVIHGDEAMIDTKTAKAIFDEVPLSESAQVLYELIREHEHTLQDLFNCWSDDSEDDVKIERVKEIRRALNAAVRGGM